jgi:hypothetical protein
MVPLQSLDTKLVADAIAGTSVAGANRLSLFVQLPPEGIVRGCLLFSAIGLGLCNTHGLPGIIVQERRNSGARDRSWTNQGGTVQKDQQEPVFFHNLHSLPQCRQGE